MAFVNNQIDIYVFNNPSPFTSVVSTVQFDLSVNFSGTNATLCSC